MTKKLWTGEAAKIRRRVQAAADRNVKRKVGDSDLARAAQGSRAMFGRTFTAYVPCQNQTAAYAAALGVSLEEAAEKVAAHRRHLAACGQPFGA